MARSVKMWRVRGPSASEEKKFCPCRRARVDEFAEASEKDMTTIIAERGRKIKREGSVQRVFHCPAIWQISAY